MCAYIKTDENTDVEVLAVRSTVTVVIPEIDSIGVVVSDDMVLVTSFGDSDVGLPTVEVGELAVEEMGILR